MGEEVNVNFHSADTGRLDVQEEVLDVYMQFFGTKTEQVHHVGHWFTRGLY